MKRYCFALDLKKDDKLIQDYVDHHKKVWPEVLESIKKSGIEDMQIYRFHNRLFMIMEVDATFSFEKKEKLDFTNTVVQQWEMLMWTYQQSIPTAKPGEKWVLMEKIFQL